VADTAPSRLAEQLAKVENRLTMACQRSGRPRAEVTLVAVTKTVSADVARMLLDLGVRDLGESRPQELWRKAEALAGHNPRWHLIGHLQRNKVEKTLPLVDVIHSVDSLRLIQTLEAEAQKLGRRVPILLEVNASREGQKHGFTPEELPALIEELNGLRHLHVTGLMTMAALEADPEQCRPTFALLRRLRDELRPRLAGAHDLRDLSMGMSNDFEVAVEEGATMVRLGSILFEGIETE
jgi:pyridoxal phosphate enzyme (YggS family)